jgi:L,D-transpeptidase YcbB
MRAIQPQAARRATLRRGSRIGLAAAVLTAGLGGPIASPSWALGTIDERSSPPSLPLGASAPLLAPAPAPVPSPGLPSAMAALAGSAEVVEIEGGQVDGALARGLYAPRGFEPLWAAGDGSERVLAVVEVLRRADEHGLDPSPYHLGAIERRIGAPGERERAELDLLVSDAVMRYGSHVAFGAYRPTRTTKEIELAPLDHDPTRLALDAARAPDVRAYLDSLPPTDPGYRRLQEALARYRDAAARGGWPEVPDGPKLTPGMRGPEVAAIRARLAATGEAPAAKRSPGVYDRDLVVAVQRFQARHGLAPDGVVGPHTRQALVVSAGERVRQLEIALERSRWRPRDLGDRFVVINIPDQRLELRDRTGAVEIEMPVIVGKPSWPTPEFSASLTDLVFNPPWNVPPKIARDELLPKMRRDDSYFAREGIAVRGGVTIASASTDSLADASGPTSARVSVHGPIRLRQAPGPRNPLGRIKFNIANDFGVYLHDTPNKSPFRLADRRLSHGCVRLGDAKGLASLVMRDMPGWDDERRGQVLTGWRTRSVRLSEHLPVHIVYSTAWVDEAGEVQFREDVYGRDEDLVARWDRPRTPRLPAPPSPPEEALDAAAAEPAAGDLPLADGSPAAAEPGDEPSP